MSVVEQLKKTDPIQTEIRQRAEIAIDSKQFNPAVKNPDQYQVLQHVMREVGEKNVQLVSITDTPESFQTTLQYYHPLLEKMPGDPHIKIRISLPTSQVFDGWVKINKALDLQGEESFSLTGSVSTVDLQWMRSKNGRETFSLEEQLLLAISEIAPHIALASAEQLRAACGQPQTPQASDVQHGFKFLRLAHGATKPNDGFVASIQQHGVSSLGSLQHLHGRSNEAEIADIEGVTLRSPIAGGAPQLEIQNYAKRHNDGVEVALILDENNGLEVINTPNYDLAELAMVIGSGVTFVPNGQAEKVKQVFESEDPSRPLIEVVRVLRLGQ